MRSLPAEIILKIFVQDAGMKMKIDNGQRQVLLFHAYPSTFPSHCESEIIM